MLALMDLFRAKRRSATDSSVSDELSFAAIYFAYYPYLAA